jgi:hypothetical protein
MAIRLVPVYHNYLNNGLIYATGLAGPYLLFLSIAALALFVAGWERDSMLDVLAPCFFGFLIAAILQRKGFSYHYVTAQSLATLLLIRAWQTRPPALSWAPSGVLARLGFLILPLVPLGQSFEAAREIVQPGDGRYRLDTSYPLLLPEVTRLASGRLLLQPEQWVAPGDGFEGALGIPIQLPLAISVHLRCPGTRFTGLSTSHPVPLPDGIRAPLQ